MSLTLKISLLETSSGAVEGGVDEESLGLFVSEKAFDCPGEVFLDPSGDARIADEPSWGEAEWRADGALEARNLGALVFGEVWRALIDEVLVLGVSLGFRVFVLTGGLAGRTFEPGSKFEDWSTIGLERVSCNSVVLPMLVGW